MMDYDKILMHAFGNSTDILKLTEHLCQKVSLERIPGDFAEAGCAYGAQGIMMKSGAWLNQKVILFDSFEGISVHGPEDEEWTATHGASVADPRKSGGITVAPLEHCKETMSKYLPSLDGIEFRKGWFIDTFPLIPPDEKYSILRLDCDLYDPYMLCFQHLLPRLQKFGWLIIDDYHLSGAKKAIKEAGIKLEDFTILGETGNAYMQWL